MVRPIEFNPPEEEVIGAIQSLNGNIAAVCRGLGTNRRTFDRWMERHPNAQQALSEAREEMLDMAESSLYRQVLNGQAWAVCFFLKTQGRKRGYIERAETFNLNIDLNELDVEKLQRLAAGEHPSLVLGSGIAALPAGTAATDPLTIEGTGVVGAEAEAD